jgi:hypothetical protein
MARLRAEIDLSNDGYIASNADVHGKYLGRIHAVEKKLKFVGVPDIGFETHYKLYEGFRGLVPGCRIINSEVEVTLPLIPRACQ